MFNYTRLRKSREHIWTRIIGIFHLYVSFFENINREHNLLPDCACFMYWYVVKDVCQPSLPSCFILTTGNILFRSVLNGNYLFSSASLALGGGNSLVLGLTVIAAVELYINATYSQHLALKSVYEKG